MTPCHQNPTKLSPSAERKRTDACRSAALRMTSPPNAATICSSLNAHSLHHRSEQGEDLSAPIRLRSCKRTQTLFGLVAAALTGPLPPLTWRSLRHWPQRLPRRPAGVVKISSARKILNYMEVDWRGSPVDW